jgi:drug/metabolite transporter (DMT)-like permease
MKSGAVAPHPLAFIALLGGAAAIGFAPIFVRLSDVSPAASAFWRMALAAPLLWAWAAAQSGRTQPVPQDRDGPPGAALLAGVFFACDLAAWHIAITWTSVANATLEANVAPVFVTLGAWLLWRQRPSRLFMAALALTLAGAVLLIGPNARLGDRAFTGDLLDCSRQCSTPATCCHSSALPCRCPPRA